MKVHFQLRGLPQLYKVMNRKKDVDIDFHGSTVGDFIRTVVDRYGAPMKKAILDAEGDIDMELRVVLNNRTFLEYGDRMNAPLNEGDTLLLMTVG